MNRRMSPGLVWLTLIPLFGMVWQFFIVNKMADSLKAEFTTRNINLDENRPGYLIGLVFCTFSAISAVGNLIESIIHLQHWPDFQYTFHFKVISSTIGIIFGIIYWVKIISFRHKLLQTKIQSINPEV